jgi:hypothetical protein
VPNALFTNDLVRLATSIILAAESREIEAPLRRSPVLIAATRMAGGGGSPILPKARSTQADGAGLRRHEDPASSDAGVRENASPEISAKELPDWLEDIFARRFHTLATEYRRERKTGRT